MTSARDDDDARMDTLLRALLDDAPRATNEHDARGAQTLTARVRWLERVIAALAGDAGPGREGSGDDDVKALAADPDVVAARTDLQAAIGAIVAWGRGPRTPESVAELEVVMRALIGRGLSTLYRALARDMQALADARVEGTDVDACAAAARAFATASAAVGRGEPVPDDVKATLDAVRAKLPSTAQRGR